MNFWPSKLIVISLWSASAVLNAAEMVPTNATVGRNLQVSASVSLTEQAPEGGLQLTVASSNPSRFLLSKTPEAAGSDAIVLDVRPGFRTSPDFWVQGVGEPGSETYMVTAPGFTGAAGSVTVAPSGILLFGPFHAPKFMTTINATPTKLTAKTVLLDASFKYVEEQMVAGGRSFSINVTSSNPLAGVITESPLTIEAAQTGAETYFKPAGAGETILAVSLPPGFSPVANSAGNITANVRVPGLAVTDQIAIGQNLEVGGILSLGEAAPEGGLSVTLTSSDPAQLLLSPTATEIGSKTLVLRIPAGGVNAPYFLQALGGAGVVTYTASAPGYTSRTGIVTLTPSGVMITLSASGPPDEGEFLHPKDPVTAGQFISTLSAKPTVPLTIWTAQLDPATKRGADITVQPLRAGLSLEIPVSNANPAIGSFTSSVLIKGGSEHAIAPFTGLTAGSTVISVATPPGFTKPSNATSVTAVVQP